MNFSFQRNLAILIFTSILLTGIRGWSYASFIGYGYTNCTTCHYNPHGNGQLNDYGRALFASEIAAKPFWKPKATDEELANHSSFTFGEPTPRSFHPSFKYRELLLTTSPGGLNSNRQIVMEADAGFAYHFDANDKYIFVASAGYTRLPVKSDTPEHSWYYNLMSREHYLRIQLNEEQFLSVGLMDIVYGLRIVDHTSSNRRGIGLDQNDQVHGVLYDYFKDKWMFGLHGFAGNQLADESTRLSGASSTVEYAVAEKFVVGASALAGSTQLGKSSLFRVHARMCVRKGSSLMAELGTNKSDPKTRDVTTGA